MKRAIVAVIALMCFASLFAFAQDAPKMPKYLWVQNISLAGDKTDSYVGLVAQYRRAVEAAKVDSYWIAASNLSGDLRMVSFVSAYESMESAEKDFAN